MESLFVEWIYVVFFVLTCRIVTGRNPKMCPGGILGPLLSSPKCTFWYPYDLLGHSFQHHFDFYSVRCVLLEKKMRLGIFATLPRFGLVWAGFGLVLVIKGGTWGALGGPGGLLGGLKGLSGRLGDAPRPQSGHTGQKGCPQQSILATSGHHLGALGVYF